MMGVKGLNIDLAFVFSGSFEQTGQSRPSITNAGKTSALLCAKIFISNSIGPCV
jgi:hypothetical protein